MSETTAEQAHQVDLEANETRHNGKPRGKCTGCSFSYQLGTARTGEYKGQLVIRKHNSRTGPGLCSGASAPPESADTQNISQHGEDLTAAYSPQEPACEQCEDDPDYCSAAPHDEPQPGDVVGVAPGGTPIVVQDPFTAPAVIAEGAHCQPRACSGCCGCSQECTDTPCTGARPITIHPETVPVIDTRTMRDLAQSTLPPHTVLAPDAEITVTGVPLNIPVSIVPDPFTAPGAASDIPESTVTVSGQPEPDRDRWGRYLIMGTAHTRATTFAKLGANTKAIEAWNERNVIRGLTLRPDLLMLANGLEVKRDRNDLNSIASQAKDAAGSKVAANIGTAYHAFSERVDAGLHGLEAVPDAYRNRVQQYVATVRGAGLTTRPEWIERTTAVRADQVSAPLPVAGTLDRIFQLPDGSLVIGDLKTGSDLSYGEMEIEVQLALYAHGVNTHGLFDWNTKTWQRHDASQAGYNVNGEQRTLEVRTDIAIVVHLPADGDGCTLFVADIERGWRDAQRLGQLQASLKDKPKGKRFRTLMASDLAPRPEPAPERGEVAEYLAVQPSQVGTPVVAPPDSQWEHAKHLFSTAGTQARIAELYQYAMDSGKFHQDQLAVLVGLGKDRLNALASEPPF